MSNTRWPTGDQTESCAGKKNRANERLITQWCERAGLEVANLSHQFVERQPFHVAFPA